jgi:sugar lactone lactonase YvrE
MPACVIGHNYNFEPVPTDIELGPDGLLYVSALTAAVFAGAPAGEVFTINPNTGAVRLFASGFLGATGVAVTGNGTVYVAELMGNRISRVQNGHPTPFLAVKSPGDVEWDQTTKPGSLYATTDVLNPKGGNLIRVAP